MARANVVIYGCGVMGRKTAEALLGKKSFKIVGAVDIDPALVGKDLGEILDPPGKLGIKIVKDAEALFARKKARAVVLTTSSRLRAIFPQIAQCVKARLNVVSTCEELSYPWKRSPSLSRKIDALAKKYKVTVVGTGINPGYLMDTLPITLTAPCLRVDSIRVTRMMNSAKRRIPFQAKIGTGLTKDEFRQKIDTKIITGHVGLLESIHAIASALGWKLDEAVELAPEPVIADRDIKTGLGTVKAGKVIGLKSVAYAKSEGKDVITLIFCANADVSEEYDEIIIEGNPPICEKIIGGVHGDIGTVAVTINTIPRAVEAPSGLKTMKDLPPARAAL
jgi:4-hydroxy-tetrahydrodipicolinate reductase